MTKSKFAAETAVSPEKTLAEIQSTLKRYGATKYAYLEDEHQVGVGFEMRGWRVRFIMPLPDPENTKRDSTGRYMGEKQAGEAHGKATRQRWRALLLTIKAKLESVESGIEQFEEAFMAQIVLPSGQTMAEWAVPQIKAAYTSNAMPPLLLESGR